MVLDVILGAGLAVAAAGNVAQAINNRKLRKQIEDLTLISERLNEEITELQKKYDALKFWAFRKRAGVKKEILVLNQELAANEQEISNLLSQIVA